MFNEFHISKITGIKEEDVVKLARLLEVYNERSKPNAVKNKYYEGHVKLSEVNLGIALPEKFGRLEIGCDWGAKAVDVLAARSMLDGFVGRDGNTAEGIDEIVTGNRLIEEYPKACRDELKYGCTFATLSKDPKTGCAIKFHTPETAAAEWSGAKGRIDYGLAIIDAEYNRMTKAWNPNLVNMYTDAATIILTKEEKEDSWQAEYIPHKLGRPLMEPLAWDPTSRKPFGRSRLKYAVRKLIDGYIRTVANATIALEFSTTPQKYMLGLTDEQFDAVVSNKFKQYMGAILAATSNPDTGEKPSVGQFQQGSLTPHVEMLRILATQFSAATGLSVTDTGVVNNANPTSSDAILAQTQTLILMAEQLNLANGEALNMIMRMAQAIAQDKTLDELEAEEVEIMAHFKNPSMPSVAVTADAAVKIATSRPEFASTDVYLEMIGFDQADIRRIKAQEQRARGQKVLIEEIER